MLICIYLWIAATTLSNNAVEHSCEGRTCRSCNRNNTCPDYDNLLVDKLVIINLYAN